MSMLFKTDEAQKRNHMPMPHEEHGEQVIRKARQTMNGRQLTTYQSPLLVPKEDAAELKKRLLYTMIGVNNFGEFSDQAAAATAQLALSFGLNPFNGEIWPIPQKGGGKIKGFTVYVGYKGLHRAARDVARNELNTDFLFGAAKVLPPDEVKERGAHRCFRCGGSGAFSGGGKCFKCDGKKFFDPKEVVVVCIPLSLLSKVRLARELSLAFEPTWGVGVWQPGDNIAEGRDPQWMATKRAKADALRQEFDLPFSYGERSVGDEEPKKSPAITIIDPGEQELHPYVEAARIASISYDDEAAFIEMVDNAINEWGFESVGHVLEAFNDMEHYHIGMGDFEIAQEALIQWLSQTIDSSKIPPMNGSIDQAELERLKSEFFKRMIKEIPYFGRPQEIGKVLKAAGITLYSVAKEDEMKTILEEYAKKKADEEAATA